MSSRQSQSQSLVGRSVSQPVEVITREKLHTTKRDWRSQAAIEYLSLRIASEVAAHKGERLTSWPVVVLRRRTVLATFAHTHGWMNKSM